jgi:hypothetical protein
MGTFYQTWCNANKKVIFWEWMTMKDNTFTPKFDENFKCTLLTSIRIKDYIVIWPMLQNIWQQGKFGLIPKQQNNKYSKFVMHVYT